jgi:protein-S-isoprenylcysteine O-methyltransferase Ste14
MPHTIYGLPTHVLLIHVVVILIPLGALFTVLSAVWPAARRKLGFISPLTCAAALAFVPITTNAGHWLQNKIDPSHANQAIDKHANLASNYVFFAIGLFVISAAVWVLGRRFEIAMPRPAGKRADTAPQPVNGGGGGVGTTTATRTQPQATRTALPVWASSLLIAAAVVMSLLAVWQLYRIGDAGAHAVWDGIVSR